MITAIAKAALYNLWLSSGFSADCIEGCWQGEARPALRAKAIYKGCRQVH
jgi:hypothetical protein